MGTCQSGIQSHGLLKLGECFRESLPVHPRLTQKKMRHGFLGKSLRVSLKQTEDRGRGSGTKKLFCQRFPRRVLARIEYNRPAQRLHSSRVSLGSMCLTLQKVGSRVIRLDPKSL